MQFSGVDMINWLDQWATEKVKTFYPPVPADTPENLADYAECMASASLADVHTELGYLIEEDQKTPLFDMAMHHYLEHLIRVVRAELKKRENGHVS